MTSFRITVRKGGRDLWWYLPGVREPKEGRVQDDPLALQNVQMLGALLAEGHIDKRERLEIVGSLLYRMLFDEEMDKQFLAVKDGAGRSKTALRVVLEFEPRTDHLALLPWEYLYRPGSDGGAGFFVAAQEYLVLSRYVNIGKPWADWEGQEIVRILIVTSGPRDLDIVKTGSALTFLKNLADNSGGKVVIENLKQPTRKSFEDALRNEPHIVHFIGHGEYEKDNGFIMFVGDDGKSFPVIDQDFAAFFESRDTRLVFLEVCEGAASGSYTAFSGAALSLVYNRLPAVIAMRYEISNEVANAFSLRFYQELQKGRPIDKAVQAGRGELGKFLEIQNFSSREFGCPVLFLQTAEDMDAKGVIPFPQIVPAGEPSASVEEPTPDPNKAYYCPKPRCPTELNPRSRCCTNCGSEWRLHTCGNPYLLGSNFCGDCGKPISRAAATPAAAPAASALAGASRPEAERFVGEGKNIPSAARTGTGDPDNPTRPYLNR